MYNILIAMLLPPVVALYLLDKSKRIKPFVAMELYLILLMFTNIISVLISYYIFKQDLIFNDNFYVMYSIISIITSLIFYRLITFSSRNIKLSFTLASKEKHPKNIISKFFLLMTSLIVGSLAYYHFNFSYNSIEELYFTITTNLKGTSPDVIKDAIIFIFTFGLAFFIIMYFLLYTNKSKLFLHVKKKKYSIIPLASSKSRTFLSLLFLGLVIIGGLEKLKFRTFIIDYNQPSTIYEKYYVSPDEVDIIFPEKKKNLIHIIVESLETTLFSQKNGGLFEESIIPELEEIAMLNTSFFSKEDSVSGLVMPSRCDLTVGGMICQMAGINLRGTLIVNEREGPLLPGAYPLGRILNKENYNTKLLMGSDSGFHKRKNFFYEYAILDYYKAQEEGYIEDDYHKWWGFEDSVLYEIAKAELIKMSSSSTPFAITLLTADTHFPDGYVDESCPIVFKDNYLSSYACASTMLSNFIGWIKTQSFYKDTVIVITGDHISKQDKVFKRQPLEKRYIYNAIINSRVKPSRENIIGSSFDVFPTILASLGVEIEDNRLGLGTNLFSNKETLIEELGKKMFMDETYKKSNFYNNNIVRKSSE